MIETRDAQQHREIMDSTFATRDIRPGRYETGSASFSPVIMALLAATAAQAHYTPRQRLKGFQARRARFADRRSRPTYSTLDQRFPRRAGAGRS